MIQTRDLKSALTKNVGGNRETRKGGGEEVKGKAERSEVEGNVSNVWWEKASKSCHDLCYAISNFLILYFNYF